MSDLNKTKIPIEKATSRNLKRAYNVMHVESNRLFRSMEITVAQFDLMETVLLSENRKLTIQDLASKTVSLQPNTTRMVADLESAGLVERTSGNDRRIVIVRLTPKGVETVKAVQKPLMEMHRSQYKNLTEDEIRQLNELLIKISRPLS